MDVPAAPAVKFAEPDITDLEIDAVVSVMKSGWITTGPKCAQLEERFHKLTGKTALACSSATAAQLVAMRAWMDVKKIPVGSHVIVSALTFASTILNLMHLGLKPVFCDIDPDTLQPTVETIGKCHDPKTVAVLVTHYGGYPCPMDDIWTWAKMRRVTVIDDAAHCLPTRYKGWWNGSWHSDLTFFSFYATKTIACAEGGLAAIHSEEIAKVAKQYRLHGMSKDAFGRYQSLQAGWEYDIVVEGYKANLPDLLAAMALVQLDRMYEIHERRKMIWNRYFLGLEDLEGLVMPWPDSKDVEQSAHLFPIQVPAADRNGFIEQLRERGVLASVHFKPLHQMSVWKGRKPNVPVVDAFTASEISLPIYSRMTQEQVQHVIKSVREIANA